jgi:hypothetical protein
MRSLVYLVACTVDGFIAAANGSVDCFPHSRARTLRTC